MSQRKRQGPSYKFLLGFSLGVLTTLLTGALSVKYMQIKMEHRTTSLLERLLISGP